MCNNVRADNESKRNETMLISEEEISMGKEKLLLSASESDLESNTIPTEAKKDTNKVKENLPICLNDDTSEPNVDNSCKKEGHEHHSEVNENANEKEVVDPAANENSDTDCGQQLDAPLPNSEFKLRIVPIEKLLEKPSSEENTPADVGEDGARLNVSVIELSDSDEEKVAEAQVQAQIVKDQMRKVDTSGRSKKKAKKSKSKKDITTNNIATDAITTNATTTTTVVTNYKNLTRRCAVRLKRIPFPVIVQESIVGIANVEGDKNDKDHNATNMSEAPAVKASATATASSSSSSTSSSSSSSSPSPSSSHGDKPSSSKRRKIISSESDESDFNPRIVPKRTCAQSRDSPNGSAKNSHDSEEAKSTDSEVIPRRKKRIFGQKKTDTDQDSDFDPVRKAPPKRQRRIRKNSTDDSDALSGDEKKNKRKHIRKIIKTKDLDISTKTATKEEEERRKRIEERQKLYNKIYEKPDSVEVNALVLDFDDETKKPLLEVDKGILKKLKPHQVSGVKFMWDACFETVKDTTEKPGSGCILAHCMGLGKTLQIVTLSHTLLINAHRTNVERVLVISPLSTLNNWAREFAYWMSHAIKKNIEIYDMSKYRDKPTRIFNLNEWFQEGGVCIIGYDMYRILANDKAKGVRKKQRETLQKALVEPGPDLVICDEGHLLKNEKTSISQAVTKMRTKRRIVLTGTPLQNNLKEYYCMIQFVKPNLLGTYKEYLNRFVNPISNGQYTDSTERDIRLMKHRSHILHKMLEGCIQRKDYSVLAPYLPPKYEYVVYTTLSELQQQLYEFYMTTQRDLISSDIGGKGARLFQDFQDLRRIWTHPMSLRVNSDSVIRKRIMANDSDSMEDFVCDDEEEDEETAMSSDSSEISLVSPQSSDAEIVPKGTKKSEITSNVSRRKTRNDTNKKKRQSANHGNKNNGNNDDSDDNDDDDDAAADATDNNDDGSNNGGKDKNNDDDGDDDDDDAIIIEPNDPSEWWKKFVKDKELNNIHHSPKLFMLMRLLQQCEAIGDKLLVFSQSLQSLDVIEHFLSLINVRTKGQEIDGDVGDFKGLWSQGRDYFRLDGSCSVENREAMCKQFNDVTNLRARLFLISTRAGGLGINLVAANRVVIFDVSWNPSHDTQSIFRVYRFGQDKPCYIYRLIAMGTMEQKVYERQVAKQATAKRVIDEQQISRHYNQNDLQELYTYELKPSVERETPILPKDRLFAELLSEHVQMLFKYHEHDSLLENEESENLSEAERKAAWSEYEAEKTRSVQTAQYISYDRNAFGGHFGNSSGSITSNKIFGFRSDVLLQLLNMKITNDHLELNQNQVLQLVPSYLERLYAEMNNGDPTMYKELLMLHSTLAHPSGMYMNPLLYANQHPSPMAFGQVPPVQPPIVPNPTPAINPDEIYEID